MTPSTQAIRLDFGRLPLVEAALRVSLAAPSKLTYATIYRLHQALSAFPELREPQFFEAKPGFTESIQLGPGELPGAVFSGHPRGISVSLQNQVLVVRWARKPGASAPDYPRYGELRETLWKAIAELVRAAPDGIAPIAVVNMSYVNLLNVAHDSPVLSTYFAASAHVVAALRAKQLRKLEASWLESDDVDIRFNIEQVTVRVNDQDVQGYRLTTAAGKRLAPAADAQAELDVLHSRLQTFFLSLISEAAKREWELSGADSSGKPGQP